MFGTSASGWRTVALARHIGDFWEGFEVQRMGTDREMKIGG